MVLLEEGKRPLGGPECRWEDNISMDVNERVWTGLAASGHFCEHSNEHSGSINHKDFC